VVRDRIELSTFRFSVECPGPCESTTGHLIRPDDPLEHLGIHDRLAVSTAIVSTTLATGIFIQRSDLVLLGRGSRITSADEYHRPFGPSWVPRTRASQRSAMDAAFTFRCPFDKITAGGLARCLSLRTPGRPGDTWTARAN
jgi:hypothetical protein